MNGVVSADDMAPQILVEPQPTGEVVLVGSPPPRVVYAQPVDALVDQTQPDTVVVDVRPPIPLVTEQKLEQVVLAGVRGRPGRDGSDAGDIDVQRMRGETLSALVAVYELDGLVYALDPGDENHIDLLLGITLTAGTAGTEVRIRSSGVVDNSGWSWVPGRVWLGPDGTLTQIPPTQGFDVLVGAAVSATRVILNIQDSIELE